MVSTDLQARVRADAAAASAGLPVRTRRPDETGPLGSGVILVILDLDQIADAPGWVAAAGELPHRLVGFFSHVREEVGASARQAGVEVYPRGRFWRELPGLIAGEV